MNVKFAVYDLETGRIKRGGSSSDTEGAMMQNHNPGEGVLVGIDEQIDGERSYVVDGQIVPRPVLAFDKLTILADDSDTATLTGLPDPCTVIVDGEPHEIAGGVLQITSDMPATYEIEIEDPFPAQYFKATIHAVEAL